MWVIPSNLLPVSCVGLLVHLQTQLSCGASSFRFWIGTCATMCVLVSCICLRLQPRPSIAGKLNHIVCRLCLSSCLLATASIHKTLHGSARESLRWLTWSVSCWISWWWTHANSPAKSFCWESRQLLHATVQPSWGVHSATLLLHITRMPGPQTCERNGLLVKWFQGIWTKYLSHGHNIFLTSDVYNSSFSWKKKIKILNPKP